jgi:glutathione S-transferase
MTSIPVDFYPGRQHKADWFLKLNPFGQLPVLQGRRASSSRD